MNRINESNPKTIQNNPPKRPQTTTQGALGPSWEGLGGVLGRSWELLGPLGTVLTAILGPTDHKIKNRSLRVNGWQGLGSILEVKMLPKTTPKRSQNESKIDMNNASLFYPSWSCLGAILGRSWTPSGGQKPCFSIGFTTIL